MHEHHDDDDAESLNPAEGPEMPSSSDEEAHYEPTSLSRWLPIPNLFHSVEKSKPFQTCLHCGRNLLETGEQYLIEKVFRRMKNDQQTIEPIIELAICLNCRDSEGQSMSEDSADALRGFFENRIDLGKRIVDLSLRHHNSESADAWIDTCLFSGKQQSSSRDFQVVALCQGSKMLRDFFPIMISGEVMEEISTLLSDQTQGWMDDFIGDNFGMPSEFIEPPNFTPVLM